MKQARTGLGILGGSFDPIHFGHIRLAKAVYQHCTLKTILLIPCKISPSKLQPPRATPQERLAMIKLAIKNYPFLAADDFELTARTPSYTINTLEYLVKKTNDPLFLIMGDDAFNFFTCWRKWQTILTLTNLITVSRRLVTSSNRTLLPTKPFPEFGSSIPKAGSVYTIPFNNCDISSSKIRAIIEKKQNIGHLTPKSVGSYINDNHLYFS